MLLLTVRDKTVEFDSQYLPTRRIVSLKPYAKRYLADSITYPRLQYYIVRSF